MPRPSSRAKAARRDTRVARRQEEQQVVESFARLPVAAVVGRAVAGRM